MSAVNHLNLSTLNFAHNMAHGGQIQLMHSPLLCFTGYLHNMKGRVIMSMEKCNVCILLRQYFNKNISHPIITHGLFFLITASYLKKFESKLKPSSKTCETKIHQKKIPQPSEEKKDRKNLRNSITRIVRIEIFTKKELEKKVKEKTSAHITLQTRLWCKDYGNPSGRLKNTSLWIHVILFLLMHLHSCESETLKRPVNVSTICLKTLVMFCHPNVGLPVPEKNNSKEKSFT